MLSIDKQFLNVFLIIFTDHLLKARCNLLQLIIYQIKSLTINHDWNSSSHPDLRTSLAQTNPNNNISTDLRQNYSPVINIIVYIYSERFKLRKQRWCQPGLHLGSKSSMLYLIQQLLRLIVSIFGISLSIKFSIYTTYSW